MFLKNRNFISKIKRSKVTDHAALTGDTYFVFIFLVTCPLGYYQDTVTENCLACPDGKYGVDTPNGPECHDCPLRAGPNMTALTSPDQCSKPGKKLI